MKRIFAALGFLSLSLLMTNCKKDDGGTDYVEVPLRDRTEVYNENMAVIEKYLDNNYIIENGDIITFDSITSPNYKKQPVIRKDPRLKSIKLSNDILKITPISTKTVDPYTGMYKDVVSRLEYTKNDDPVKEYTVYYLEINKGENITPALIDSTYVETKVYNTKNEVVSAPFKGKYYSFPMTINEYTATAAKAAELTSGERQLLQLIKTATGLKLNSDGTLGYDKGSAGRIIAFIPSGLYLFNSPIGTKLKGYEVAISDITLINALERDHDLDGIPSKYEVEPSKIGTPLTIEDYFGYSTSGFEKTPNFLNIDDDNDGVPTRIELQYKDDKGIIRHYKYDAPELKKCSDKPNYLDKNCRPYMVDGEWVWNIKS